MEVIKGRMYDYNNGRFLSVDPFIQNPTSTQSMNPYTYIFNNPLSGVDPSGYYSLFDPYAPVDPHTAGHYPSLAEVGENIETTVKTSKVVVVGTVVVTIAIKIDEISDYVAPVKGLIKNGIKGTVKYALKNGKEIAGKVKQGFKNISDILKPKAKIDTKIMKNADKDTIIVNKDGAAIHNTTQKNRESLENAGFKGEKITNNSGTDTGTKHVIPDKKMDVRVMEGDKNHPPRVVVNRTGNPKQGVNMNTGKNIQTKGGTKSSRKREERERSHIQDKKDEQ